MESFLGFLATPFSANVSFASTYVACSIEELRSPLNFARRRLRNSNGEHLQNLFARVKGHLAELSYFILSLASSISIRRSR